MKVVLCLCLFFLERISVHSQPVQIVNTNFYTDYIKRTWDGCLVAAESYGISFASVHSEEENGGIDTQYWLGGKRDCETCPFYWADGTPWDYDNWAPQEPKSGSFMVKMKYHEEWRSRGLQFENGNMRHYMCLFRSIKPWEVGITSLSNFDKSSGVNMIMENEIGPYVTQAVYVELFDYDCSTPSIENVNNTVSLKNVKGNERPFSYEIEISESKIATDPQNFVNFIGPSSMSKGNIKFCTRVTTQEGSLDVGFLETNFILSFDLTNIKFNISDVAIEEKGKGNFTSVAEDDRSVKACQCENFACVDRHPVEQAESLIVCIYADHPYAEGGASITNFNLKLSASSGTDYYEYNPVWFGDDRWEHDRLTQIDLSPDGIIQVSTVVVAQFYVQGYSDIDLSLNTLLTFDSSKNAQAPILEAIRMNLDLDVQPIARDCKSVFLQILNKIQKQFWMES